MDTEKTLILVRHAKSSWDHPGLPDHDRPLNPRGRRDAPRMTRRLADRGIIPQRILTSSATRALTTAQVFAEGLGLPDDAVVIERSIYGADFDDVLEEVRALDDDLTCVMLVGHNPTFFALANGLTGSGIGHLPTCSVVTMRLDARRWRDARAGGFELVDFDFPKKNRGKRTR